MFSQYDFDTNGIDWVAEGKDIVYAHNGIPRDSLATLGGDEGMFYTFSFSYTFRHTRDTVHFAYVKPYTVSMHRAALWEVKEELRAQARSFKVLEEGELYKKLRKVSVEQAKRPRSKEDPVKSKEQQASTMLMIEENATLNREHLVWRSEEFQIETDSLIYRQETLCRVLSGFPIEAITVTAHKCVVALTVALKSTRCRRGRC
eukprot:TRINITY_DN13741_c0_g7_i1.p1 TRINITY_DN13741_c0_g7~~TRINITY_DN13741_c0_g7_i1.p1  ORF type:complete len:203 (+),score=38.66 TRINITY_DN13741_c0_g7_i1:676-1284(+)